MELILSRVTHVDDDGYTLLDIFEHTLSEYGSIYMGYLSHDDCKVFEGRYSSFSGTLEEVFDHIRRNHWYE